MSSSSSQKRKRQDWISTCTDSGNDKRSPLLTFAAMKKVTCEIARNVDFEELAATYPEFQVQYEKLKIRQRNNQAISSFSANVDFDFNVALTRSLLHKHFQLHLKIMPRGYLCPPVPNRLNYVLWLKDLIRESSTLDDGRYFDESPIPPVCRGLDIGTGCSCIYPLLLSRDLFTKGKKWHYLATDVDPFTVACAQENVDANDLQDVIQIALVEKTHEKGGPRDLTLESLEESVEWHTPLYTAMSKARQLYSTDALKFDFCMTNPPFYSSESEALNPRAGDGRERADMTFHESVYPGGEMGFALDMIYDSLVYRGSITWYSLMISKKKNLFALEKELEKIGLTRGSIRIVEFDQGHMKRWGLAWTFLTPFDRSPGEHHSDSLLMLGLVFMNRRQQKYFS